MSTDKPALTLAMTVHDPDRRLYGLSHQHLPAILPRYNGCVALCSPTTHPDTLQLLEALGAILHFQQEGQVDVSILGNVRLATIAAAAELGGSHCHMVDHDRLLHWQMRYPDELARATDTISDYDFLVFGRTARAFGTHPQAQQATESLVTRAFELAWGEPWDITAGSRGLSRRAIGYLLEHAREPSVGNDGEWPLVLRRFPELRIGYRATEGLEFETTDRYPDEIAALGGVEAWMRAHYDTLSSWEARIRTAYLITAAIRRVTEFD